MNKTCWLSGEKEGWTQQPPSVNWRRAGAGVGEGVSVGVAVRVGGGSGVSVEVG